MPKLPDRIGKYEVVRRLGVGGMGAVYLARDPDLDRPLAVKILRDQLYEEELIQRFLREARAAGNLRHDNIITVYDAGQHDHQPFMAMEYVDGISLAEMIRTRQPLTLADKLSYLEQICAGLHYAHGHGIVHRDIKPANLMVDRRNVVRILDFGIARVEGSGMTRDGALIGTLNYMSPEQMLGRPIDHRSDIFAFGAVAYELIAYERAFPGSIEDGLLHRLPQEPPRPLAEACPGLPDGVEAVVLRALAKSPHDRFGDLDEARSALRRIRREVDPQLELEPVTTRPHPRSGPSPTPTPGSGAERREFLERRARQVAYHRDAARTALASGDLDGAAAACEDALTLDPDDHDALALLADIQQAREQRVAESRERRDRERTIRKHLADADLRMSKGDVPGAAELLRLVLTLDPGNAVATGLLRRIEQAAMEPEGAAAPTVVLREDRRRPAVPDGDEEPAPSAAGRPERTIHAEPTVLLPPAARRPSRAPARWPVMAAAVAVVVMAGGGALWFSSRGGDVAPAAPTASVPAAADPAPVPAPVPVAAASPSSSAPLPASPVNAPPSSPAPEAAVPEPSRGTAVADRALQEQLTRIEQTYQRGNLEEALRALRPVAERSRDPRAATLARSIAAEAFRSMSTGAARARGAKAAELSPALFATAESARAAYGRASARGDFIDAASQALIASATYGAAERDASAITARAATAAPPAAADRPAAPASPPVTTPLVATASNTTPAASAPAPAGTAATAGAPAAAAVNTLPPAAVPTPPAAAKAAETAAAATAAETSAMLGVLNRFKFAYREKNMKALIEVFPAPPREMREGWADMFDACRSTDVTHSNVETGTISQDATSASIFVRSTYFCQPRSRQGPQEIVQNDVFRLRKSPNGWIIDDIGAMNAGRR